MAGPKLFSALRCTRDASPVPPLSFNAGDGSNTPPASRVRRGRGTYSVLDSYRRCERWRGDGSGRVAGYRRVGSREAKRAPSNQDNLIGTVVWAVFLSFSAVVDGGLSWQRRDSFIAWASATQLLVTLAFAGLTVVMRRKRRSHLSAVKPS